MSYDNNSGEDTWFRDWIQTNEIAWTELVRRKNPRRKNGPDEAYRPLSKPPKQFLKKRKHTGGSRL